VPYQAGGAQCFGAPPAPAPFTLSDASSSFDTHWLFSFPSAETIPEGTMVSTARLTGLRWLLQRNASPHPATSLPALITALIVQTYLHKSITTLANNSTDTYHEPEHHDVSIPLPKVWGVQSPYTSTLLPDYVLPCHLPTFHVQALDRMQGIR
jgi:hypothetical protein